MQDTDDTNSLMAAAERGDHAARNELLERHRGRLRKMVTVRLDRRLHARVDPSDVLQDTFMKAHRRFDDFLQKRPIAFYPWLRQLAWERLADLHQRHVGAEKRSVNREVSAVPLPNESTTRLVDILAHSDEGPQTHAIRQEARSRLMVGLQKLSAVDREVLVLRFLEELSIVDAAAVLEISEAAVSMRQLRAITRLKSLLGES